MWHIALSGSASLMELCLVQNVGSEGSRETDLKMSFLNWAWLFWNWLSDLTGSKGINDPVSRGKEGLVGCGIQW